MRVLDADLQLVPHPGDSLGCDQPALGGVGHQQQVVHVTRGAAAQVLHARLVVDHHVAVVAADRVDHVAQVVVHRAVAAWALGAAHRDQVEAVAFGKRRADLVVEVLALGHPAVECAHRRTPGSQ